MTLVCYAGNEWLYWYSIQDEGGQGVEESENWIDKIHLQYWDKCIDPDFRPVELTTEVVIITENIMERCVLNLIGNMV
nr:DUF6176 family protein [Oceanobacillus arenosus]